MEAVNQQCIAEFGTKFGLLCLSASASEPVMWSHYADRHAGGVLELEVNPNPECCVKVEYTDQRPAFEMREIVGPNWSRAAERVFAQLWRRKSKGWAYEQEYRYYSPLEACEERDGIHITPLVPRMLRRVILGWRCSIEQTAMSRLLSEAGYSDCLVDRARPGESSYAVDC